MRASRHLAAPPSGTAAPRADGWTPSRSAPARWPWFSWPVALWRFPSRRARVAQWTAVLADLGPDDAVHLVAPWFLTPWLVDPALEATIRLTGPGAGRPGPCWRRRLQAVGAALRWLRGGARAPWHPVTPPAQRPGGHTPRSDAVVAELTAHGVHRATILLDEIPPSVVLALAAHLASGRSVTGIGWHTLARGLFGHAHLSPSLRLALWMAESDATRHETARISPQARPPAVGRSWWNTGWETVLLGILREAPPHDPQVKAVCKRLLMDPEPGLREFGLHAMALVGQGAPGPDHGPAGAHD